MEIGHVSVFFVKTGSHVFQTVLTLALQVHLELRAPCFYITSATITDGTTWVVRTAVGIEPRTFYMLSSHSANRGMSIAVVYIFPVFFLFPLRGRISL